MAFIKPFILVFGGNTGSEPVSDVWLINLDKSPFIWNKLEITQEVPSVRVYHAASVCNTGSANGMMIIFGGRTSDSSALNDTWGLRRHRDGRWDWVKAPYKHQAELPIHRYQVRLHPRSRRKPTCAFEPLLLLRCSASIL